MPEGGEFDAGTARIGLLPQGIHIAAGSVSAFDFNNDDARPSAPYASY